MALEIVIGIVALALILGMFGGSMLLMLVILPRMQDAGIKRRYPVVVPGWKTRLSEHPPFDATVEDFAKMNELLVQNAVKFKGYKKKDATQKVNNTLWTFYKGQNGKRAVPDPAGRMGKDGKIMLVAGWHQGDEVHLVWIDGDTIDVVAAAHEDGHELHELEGVTDYPHLDLKMWGGKVEDGKDYSPFGPFGEPGTIVEGVVQSTKKQLRQWRESKNA